MKKTVCGFGFSILLATFALTYSQRAADELNGTWRVQGVGDPFPWTLVLRVDGPRVARTASACSSGRGGIDVYEGKVDGYTITFRCKSPNQARTITFTGRIRGDEITFTWEKQVREGADAGPRNDTLFGPSAT